ncbi:Uncharacterised protein [Mycobacteroides abscessus subsp. abscessus]|nr:Uncharacterised protein [Mycobacteroides abscessus subsp. abscessus]
MALPEYRNRCGRVKNVSGPTSLCHCTSHVVPVAPTRLPSSTPYAPNGAYLSMTALVILDVCWVPLLAVLAPALISTSTHP